MKKLEILVPQYKEGIEILKNLLNSIELQQGIDFNDIGVIIANDGSDVIIGEDNFKNYSYEIKYLKAPHGGVSHTRNFLIDNSTADYIMFCDADDMFGSAFGMYLILAQINNQPFEMLISLFYEEAIYEGKRYFIEKKQDRTFVHGKVYNRQFLLDNNLRWNDKLTIHEDSYFNYLVQSYTKQIQYCSTPFYLWKWRDDSTVRKDDKLMLKTYKNFTDSGYELIKELMARGKKEEAEHFLTLNVFDAYYVMNKPEWINQENANYREETELHFAKIFSELKSIWDGVSDEVKARNSMAVRNKYVKEGMQMESMTILQWLSELLKKVD